MSEGDRLRDGKDWEEGGEEKNNTLDLAVEQLHRRSLTDPVL